MHGRMTRRELLNAGAAAGVLALGADPLIQQAMAAFPRVGKLTDIEHVIILIQENRSFDHYFGTLPGVRGFGEEGARETLSQPGYPVAGFEDTLLPFHLATGGASQCFHDITHGWVPQHQSWNGGAMDGFVRAHVAVDGLEAGPATMGYYEREDIPFYHALAEAFTICDGYYCSVLGPTDPNRLYSMSATIDPDGAGGGPLIQTLTFASRDALAGRFTWTTMPEQLTAAGVSWKVYTGSPFGEEDNVLSYFRNYQTDPALAAAGLQPVYPDDFKTDLRRHELPQVSWINTSAFETEHPGLSTAKVGEHAVATLLKLLVRHPGTWGKTALFLTWDENGGFFDHVVPPTAPSGTPGEYLTVPDLTGDAGGVGGPIGLGFRVPLLVLSPFSKGGFLCSDTFDHTSLLRFLETRFGAEVPNLQVESLEPLVELHLERVQGKGDEVIVADEHGDLEQAALVVGLGELRPRSVGDLRLRVQLVGGAQQSGVGRRPAGRVGTLGHAQDLLAREAHRAVVDRAELQREDVERVVLVEPPRGLRALLGELVDRAQHVAGGEVDERLLGDRRVVVVGRALAVAVLVHVVEQAADVVAGEVALQRPRGVGVAERDRQVGHAAEHHALVAHRLGDLDLAAVDGDLHAAERQQVQAGGGDDQVGLELGAGLELEPVSVNVSMWSVTIDARPALIASNRSPSGTRHRRWSHGL